MVCRAASAKWAKLAPQECKGHATDRWTQTAAMRGMSGDKSAKPHCLVVSGPIVWCTTCGAYACSAPSLLSHPCRGRPVKSKSKTMSKQLSNLRAGIHPETKRAIHLPVPIEQWKADLAKRSDPKPAAALARQAAAPCAIVDDGTMLARAFLRRGRPAGEEPTSTAVERIRARLKDDTAAAVDAPAKRQRLLSPSKQHLEKVVAAAATSTAAPSSRKSRNGKALRIISPEFAALEIRTLAPT